MRLDLRLLNPTRSEIMMFLALMLEEKNTSIAWC